MWYIPAGVLETIWLGICGVLSWRLCGSLERSDKIFYREIYVISDTTRWEGWTKIR